MSTHWLEYGPADFDASQAPRYARKRDNDQSALFFVATPVKAPRAARAEQLPGQVSIFDTDATDTEE